MDHNPQYRVCDEFDQEFLDGVSATALACANLSAKLNVLKVTTAVCLRGPLDRLANDLLSMKQAYHVLSTLLDRQKRIWSPAATVFIRSTQQRCQEITNRLSTIIGVCTEWDVFAPDGAWHCLNTLSTSFAIEQSRLKLPTCIWELVWYMPSKPAEHESYDSIIIPEFRAELNHREQEVAIETAWRRRDNAFRAAARMEDWSKELEQRFARIREVLRSRLSSDEVPCEPPLSSATPPYKVSTNMSEDLPDSDDWSSTQSTMGIMTPTEDWSNLGSDTTERGHAPAITRHSLQLCGYATASFLRLVEEVERSVRYESGDIRETPGVAERVQRLHKAYDELTIQLLDGLNAPMPSGGLFAGSSGAPNTVTWHDLRQCIVVTEEFLGRNTIIQQSFGHLPGSTPVDTPDMEAMHKQFENLVTKLFFYLAAPMPFQDDRFTSAPAPAPAPEVSRPVIPEIESEEAHIDKTLDAIINSMEPEPTDKDIMKLVFHWTTLDECNGYKRADVMNPN